MTTVCAGWVNNKPIIAADKLTTTDRCYSVSKLIKGDSYIIGVSGSLACKQAIEATLSDDPSIDFSSTSTTLDSLSWLHRTLIEEYGFSSVVNEEAHRVLLPVEMIILTDDRIYEVHADLAILEVQNNLAQSIYPFTAIGSGKAYALGNLHRNTYELKEVDLVNAVLAASAFDIGTAFDVEVSKLT
jgi:ATP-dependent protease HslVU (ClpYQ) peptidase subunit